MAIPALIKRVSIISLTLALTLCCFAGLTGCAAQKAADASTTRTVTDALGRAVAIPVIVNTAATNGFATRMVTYAGAADKVIGVADIDKSAPVSMPYAFANSAIFDALPSASAGGANNVTYDEQVMALAPDVIISTDPDISVSDRLQQKTGIPVIAINQDVVFGETTFSSLALLGEVFNTTEHTEKVTAAMKAWQSDLNDRTKGIPDSEKPTVYSGAVNYKGFHGMGGTYGEYMPFVSVNAKNVVDESGQRGPLVVDLEQVAKWDPEYIFLNPTNMNLVNDEYTANPGFFQNLQAFRNGDIYSQPSYNYNGANIELAIADAYYIGTIIYPEQFDDIAIEEKADEIFEVMLGVPYVSQLSGAGIGFNRLAVGK